MNLNLELNNFKGTASIFKGSAIKLERIIINRVEKEKNDLDN